MTSFNIIADFIFGIPAVFWGVIVGSIFSLSGIMLTNRASEIRQNAQFLNERKLRNDDRELTLRKETYLAAAEAVHAGILAVGRFSDLRIAVDKNLESYQEKAPAIAKVQIIASEETAKAVADLLGELSISIIRLMSKRVPLDQQRAEITLLEAQVSDFEQSRDRWLEEMKQYNLGGRADKVQWDTIDRNFQFEMQRVAESLTQRNINGANLYAQQLDFSKEVFAEVQRLTEFTITAVLAMRQELRIPTERDTLVRIFQNSAAKQKATVESFLEEAKHFNKLKGSEQASS